MRKVLELFSKAVEGQNAVGDLELIDVKFSKKRNAAIITVALDRKIDLQDIVKFESLAEKEYKLNEFKIVPICKQAIDINEKDIEGILKYYEYLSAFCRGMFSRSRIEISEEVITITLSVPNSKFLLLKKADETVGKIIKEFYRKEYKVFIQDDIKAEENFKEIKKATKSDVVLEPPKEIKVDKKPENVLGVDTTSVILGKDISKDGVYNIEELTEEFDKVSICGRIEQIEYKETKSGKIILMLDVSDKTSTICCKAFLDNKKVESISSRLKVRRLYQIKW